VKKVRVLHITGGFGQGSVETKLVQALRGKDRDRFALDLLVHTTQPIVYDDKVRLLGSKIIPCLYSRVPLFYHSIVLRILSDHEPHDIVHNHVHLYSSLVLGLFAKARVSNRISHSYNDTWLLQGKAGF